MRRLNEAAQRELQALCEENNGLLRPADVVDFARDEKTELHKFFDWDDTEAAKQWRLDQARQVIRLAVTVIKQDQPPIRALVSLTTDRKAGGGYRSLYDVLDSGELLRQLESDALAELRAVRRKYERITALSPVWKAIDLFESHKSASEQPAA